MRVFQQRPATSPEANGQRSPPRQQAQAQAQTQAQAQARSNASPCRVIVDEPDMTCDDRVHDLFTRCLRLFRSGMRHMVIDLHAVTNADTKLIACLVALHRMARAASVRLEVSLSQAVLEMTRICRLERLARELTPQAPPAS